MPCLTSAFQRFATGSPAKLMIASADAKLAAGGGVVREEFHSENGSPSIGRRPRTCNV
jgi:hypothetical protein